MNPNNIRIRIRSRKHYSLTSDYNVYKSQYEDRCIMIEEFFEAGAKDDQPILPDIPEKCAEVIKPSSSSHLVRLGEMVHIRIARTTSTARIGVRKTTQMCFCSEQHHFCCEQHHRGAEEKNKLQRGFAVRLLHLKDGE